MSTVLKGGLQQKREIFSLPDENYLIYSFVANLTMLLITENYTALKVSGSVVGIATGYGLDGPGIESQWGPRFFAPVQTGPGAHPASCTMGTVSFPGVKSGRGVTLTSHPLLVPLVMKE